MIADHDRKVNPQWPYTEDSPTDRARRVAQMYRAIAERTDPIATAECDQRAAAFGETWMLNGEDLIEDDRELTTSEAAELLNVTSKTIRNWACLNHPERPNEKLLPRFASRGRETVYLAGAVREARKTLLRTQHARTWS